MRSPRRSANARSDQIVRSPYDFVRLVDLQHVAPAVRRRREAVAGGARGADRRDRVRREPLDALVEALRLPGALRAGVTHPVGERGQAADLGLLARRDLAQPLFVLRARVEVLRVGALVLAQVAFVEVQHLGDRLVEQLEVVAHDEQRAAVRAEEAHQPLLGVDVEVVGGLVEHQVVGAAEQDARQLDPPTLATGQRGQAGAARGRRGDRGRRGSGTRRTRRGSRPRRGRSARRSRSGGSPARSASSSMSRRSVSSWSRWVSSPRADSTYAMATSFARARSVRGSWGRKPNAAGDGDAAARGRALAAERAQQRGLARAVATDESDLVARVHRERRVVDEHALGDFDRQFLSADHGSSTVPAGDTRAAAIGRS